MNVLTGTVARVLYALPFGVFGIIHFIQGSNMAGIVPIPFAQTFWVYLVGVALILACISFLIEKQVRLAGILLGIMLLIFVLSISLPGLIAADSAQAMQQNMSRLLKDTALAGAAWYIAGQYESESLAAPEAPSGPETGGGEQHTGGEQF